MRKRVILIPRSDQRLRRTTAIALAALATVLSACADAPGRPAGRLAVTATTTQTAEFSRIVGGDQVDVYDLVRPGRDPHEFDPAPADLEAIRSARVIVANGVGLDHWLAKARAAAGARATVVDASTGIAVRPGEAGEPGDPHIWLDPENARAMVRTIAAGFAAADPSNATAYRARARAYDTDLVLLDGELATAIGGLKDRQLVTNHDAFGYYAARYGLTVVGSVIPSFDSAAELSAADVTALVRRIRALHVKAVFAESSLPAKAAAAIAHDAGVKVVQGDDALYGDSLGPPGSAGATYLQMMRHDTEVIVANLS